MREISPAMARASLVSGPAPARLHAAFERQAAATPEQPAIIAPDRTLDYATLDRAAARLAARLSRHAERDRLIAIEQPKGWRQILAVLGVLKSGAAYLPVDPALPAERRRYLIEQTAALELDPSWLDAALDGPLPILPAAKDTERLAYVIYTSGSTGQPKGVMIEHRAALTTVREINRRWALGPGDRTLGLSSLSFDLSVFDIFGPLSVGGAIVPAATGSNARSLGLGGAADAPPGHGLEQRAGADGAAGRVWTCPGSRLRLSCSAVTGCR